MRRGLTSLLGITAAGLAGGCGADQIELTKAIFLDDQNLNREIEPGESIALYFSRPVDLPVVTQAGLAFDPPETALGHYEITTEAPAGHTRLSNQLFVRIKSGSSRLQVEGSYAETSGATGIAIDWTQIKLIDANGESVGGSRDFVDLGYPLPAPAKLTRAHWRDTDASLTVNEGDEIELSWDRPISASPILKRGGRLVPTSLFRLPVPGDCLSDRGLKSKIRPGPDPRSQIVILGEGPRLSLWGVYQPDQHYSGSPSGIGVRGTSVSPSPYLVDRYGVGAGDPIAIDLTGEKSVFRYLAPLHEDLQPDRFKPEALVVTPLPNYSCLISGGEWRFALLYRGDLGRFRRITLDTPREGHTSTYFAGEDGEEGTRDDFIVLYGGSALGQMLTTIEIISPFTDATRARTLKTGLVNRLYHSAHALPRDTTLSSSESAGSLVVVGGLNEFKDFDATVELIEFAPNLGEYKAQRLGSMKAPRSHHQSLLVDREGGVYLFVFGGLGIEDPGFGTSVIRKRLLARPELFRFTRSAKQMELERFDVPRDWLIKPRCGHRLILLAEENFPILLIGGSSEQPAPFESAPTKDLDYELCFRFDIYPYRRQILALRDADRLATRRTDFAWTALPDGRILIAGGEDTESSTSRIEAYNPVTNRIENFCTELEKPAAPLFCFERSEFNWIFFGEGLTAEFLWSK